MATLLLSQRFVSLLHHNKKAHRIESFSLSLGAGGRTNKVMVFVGLIRKSASGLSCMAPQIRLRDHVNTHDF